MTANESKSYLSYLKKLVDQYNNIYHDSISKKSIDVDCSASTEKVETNSRAPKFKFIDGELLSIRIFLVKVALKIGQEKYLLLILF